MAAIWIWVIFVFVIGCCVGSFLNVVIYRLPRDKSLVLPPSSCPSCGKRIAFYDNIPLVSWIFLGAKCRHCKEPISVRYFVIELLTGLCFAGLFYLYFHVNVRAGMGAFEQGGWIVYVLHLVLLAAFIASSAIDLELWVIPLSICWFATAVGVIVSAIAGYVIEPIRISGYDLLPVASASSGSLAAGAAAGLIISCVLLSCGLIKRSYETEEQAEADDSTNQELDESQIKHRLEVCREVLFLLPIIICSAVAWWVCRENAAVHHWWLDFSQRPAIAGFLGSVWGYFVGCAVVWGTRILGTLGFGKEAMGLGDVHLMGAAGAVVGPVFVLIAFFVAPFFGLAWAGSQMFFKKTRQIPYGPFLSLGVFTVIILHDRIFNYLNLVFYR